MFSLYQTCARAFIPRRALFAGVLALPALLALAPDVIAQTPVPMTCGLAGSPLIVLRAEGRAELVGDIRGGCSHGTPTLLGKPVPKMDFKITFTVPVTSRVTNGNFTEVLLMLDEPNTAFSFGTLTAPQHPVLNCGHAGAPDGGPMGPGICGIIGTGDPTTVYDGTLNSWDLNACDGQSGRPSAGSYGCGRPNVFQGQLVEGDPNSIIFPGIPFDPPGSTVASHQFRITNLRVDATGLPLCAALPCASGIYATLTMGSFAPMGPVTMGVTAPGLVASVTNVGDAQHPAVIRVSEGAFQNSPLWKTKNISFVVGDNLVNEGNGSFDGTTWNYNGHANYPADVAQNIPGTLLYTTEGGFEWENDNLNGPPFPNPPPGINAAAANDIGNPLDSVGFGGVKTGIKRAGVADAGTRIALTFGNQNGMKIKVPQMIYLHDLSNPLVNIGVLLLTNTDGAGAGAFSMAGNSTLVNVDGLAVYEVLFANRSDSTPGFLGRFVDIPVTLVQPGRNASLPKNGLTVNVSLAPFYAPPKNSDVFSSLPVPRFVPSANVLSIF